MDSTKDHYTLLLQAILPEEIFSYFEITQVIIDENRLDVHLDELHQFPEEFSSEKLTSKGFQSAVVIQDYPIRERMVYLHVRKRKWLVCSTGQIVSRDWDLIAKGELDIQKGSLLF